MHIAVWNKYLPIIRILIKRSALKEQTLNLNRIDFERAGSGRKAGYKFMLEFSKGHANNAINNLPLAKALSLVLLEDEVINNLFLTNDYEISLNSKFQLGIKCLTPPSLLQDAGSLAVEEPVLELS